ncbi:Tyrosine--tRNA ligase [Venustampulla echinocandica]|uniref:tyrosine--tRNA ligase n=1 Tax=Venustampulla echinocandica TaxID=2656787 RepID=A0A370U326_9HELO|nr:Tyrosine--tRNA ligase [Venustampulla echinocandica]RDL42175.1 Tyrosine--tRNA ligase [Venustampulla echinocandica]
MATSTASDKLALIKENLSEVLNVEIIESVLAEGRPLKVYWGTAPTGQIHCGYFVPMIKIAQLLAAGCEIQCLLADIHGFLDNLKAPLDLVQQRAEYYRLTISAMLESIGVPTEKLRFVLGSSYQKNPEYIMDVYKLSSLITEHDARKAGAEIVKQSSNAPLSGLLYPILQVLDEQYLDVDVQFGGKTIDPVSIYSPWRRAHLLSFMVPGINGGKMSSSDPDSKIDILDSAEVVAKKIRKSLAVPRIVEENGLLAFVEFVLLPAAALKGRREFVVDRSRDGLEPLVYSNIEEVQNDYRNDVLNPQLLKPAITQALLAILAPIQAKYQESKEWQEITLKAYPPVEKPKKEKKAKKVGTGHPGRPKTQIPEHIKAAKAEV